MTNRLYVFLSFERHRLPAQTTLCTLLAQTKKALWMLALKPLRMFVQ